MLSVENLSFTYGGFGVEEVTISVEKGEVLALIGPNGAGKSTLLKLMFGKLRPLNGRVTVDGKDVHSLSPGGRARLLGYVPQNHVPAFPFKAIDFVLLGAVSELGTFGSPARKHRRRAMELLGLFGLSKFSDRPYTSLSGGQIQMLLIARALMTSPKFLLLDEPTSHLDLRNSVRVLSTVKALSREGVGAVIVMHDPNMAALFADRIAVMKNGRIVHTGEPEEVLREETLEMVYETRFSVIDAGVRLAVPVLEVV
ncbi:ABC transporter [Thermococcus eurythermalis]|uniref:ABC transporter n=1 Tax=Thermococcus eurythermalis TaxID=1505907 RepID=A0A097QV50_9EURY|nr:ABC transporter ATP-binding protein [Thermococcus eurythermalis]AIU70351.1 ABC transporter [Thermococcus eurythermalis]